MSGPVIRTMGNQVRSALRERILTGAYPPGSQLVQDSIAADLGVSKIPVREALVQLQGEGLVDLNERRGFQVRPLSLQELDEIFELRLRLEPAAAAAGARLASEDDRTQADDALSALNAALSDGALDLSGELNRSFHLALIVPAKQKVTAEILSRLHILGQRYFRVHIAPPGRDERAVREHTALFDAWAERRLKDLRDLTAAHIEETRADLADVLST